MPRQQVPSSSLGACHAPPAPSVAQDQPHGYILLERQTPAPAQIYGSRTCIFTSTRTRRAPKAGSTLTAAGQAGAGPPGWAHEALPHLKHVVDDVQLDDRLSPDQVVHHGVVDIVHHEIADDQNDTLQNVTHLGWLQQAPVPVTYKGIKI